MRFMLLMIPHGYESAAPGAVPTAEAVAAMMAFNESLQQAGVLRSLEGLHPPSAGVRITFEGGAPKVQPGPFPGVAEVLGGFWIIDVASKEDAIAWASRCPAAGNEVIEVRQIQEMSDFPPDVQAAAKGFTDLQQGG